MQESNSSSLTVSGGGQAYYLGVGGEGQDTPRNFEGSFGSILPYVQYCLCETSEKKLAQKPKSGLKETELSYCHHSICLQKRAYLKKNFKIR